ncbi:hypothetical protein Drorol1_Dr00020590 [Drosera rotundifolia]
MWWLCVHCWVKRELQYVILDRGDEELCSLFGLRTGCWRKKNLVEIESKDDIKVDIGVAEISDGADSEIDSGENRFCDHVDRGESGIGIITVDETKTRVNADIVDFVVENGCNEDVDAGESEMKNDIVGEMDIGVDVKAVDSRVENGCFDHGDGAKSRAKTVTEDGVESLNDMLLIGMKNRRDLLDEALLRPGQLEVQVEISLPDEAGRLQILEVYTNMMKENSLLAPYVNLAELAARTMNYSGVELEGVVKSAISFALNWQLSGRRKLACGNWFLFVAGVEGSNSGSGVGGGRGVGSAAGSFRAPYQANPVPSQAAMLSRKQIETPIEGESSAMLSGDSFCGP